MEALLKEYLPILIFLGLAFALCCAMIGGSYLIARQNPNSEKLSPFVPAARFFVAAARFFVPAARFFVPAARFFVAAERFLVAGPGPVRQVRRHGVSLPFAEFLPSGRLY